MASFRTVLKAEPELLASEIQAHCIAGTAISSAGCSAGFLQQLICQQQKTCPFSFYFGYVQEVFFENVGFYFDLRIFSEWF